jgi:hypothetical protein
MRDFKMWRYIRFYAECGYAGCDGEWYGRYDADISDAELNDFAEDYGRSHCEGYEYIHTSDFDEEGYATEEDAQEALQELSEDYWENYATWGWEEISEEEFYDNVDVVEE